MNRIELTQDACYHCTGRLQLRAADGTPLAEMDETWLCACGGSAEKPYCDGSHERNGFRSGVPGTQPEQPQPAGEDEVLIIRTRRDGPLKLDGPFEVIAADGTLLMRGIETALCRCGQSASKPFCDGTHRKAGFVA